MAVAAAAGATAALLAVSRLLSVSSQRRISGHGGDVVG